MTSPAPLYFIRHGETDWNVAGRLQGHTDTELNTNGRRQASIAARVLQGLLPAEQLETLPVYASPLRRVMQTAQIILSEVGLAEPVLRPDDRLREIGFGAWEGRTWPEIRTRDPIGARARDADLWAYAPPGGESYADVARRVQSFLNTLDAPAIIISHGGVGRTLMTLFGAPREPTLEAPIWQGRVLRLERGGIKWLPQTGHA
jgi:probable phosphoglycerate mutase